MMVFMSKPGRRLPRAGNAWAAAVLVGVVAACAWVALGLALRSECGEDDPSCDDWVVADAVATGVALGALLGWAITGRRQAWLAVATAALAVPLYHLAFV
jgi:membrane protease YdiL (CAAX protease family)